MLPRTHSLFCPPSVVGEWANHAYEFVIRKRAHGLRRARHLCVLPPLAANANDWIRSKAGVCFVAIFLPELAGNLLIDSNVSGLLLGEPEMLTLRLHQRSGKKAVTARITRDTPRQQEITAAAHPPVAISDWELAPPSIRVCLAPCHCMRGTLETWQESDTDTPGSRSDL